MYFDKTVKAFIDWFILIRIVGNFQVSVMFSLLELKLTKYFTRVFYKHKALLPINK
jgi:hypothetical protein